MKRFIKKAIFVIILLCPFMVVQSWIPSAQSEKTEKLIFYVGMKKCKNCHPEHVETYSGRKYARNFRILEMRDKDRASECLPCHTTGYGKQGGFVDIDKTPDMKNVQCEACHGPASLHVDAPTVEEHQRTLTIPENICTTCHYQHKHMGY